MIVVLYFWVGGFRDLGMTGSQVHGRRVFTSAETPKEWADEETGVCDFIEDVAVI